MHKSKKILFLSLIGVTMLILNGCNTTANSSKKTDTETETEKYAFVENLSMPETISPDEESYCGTWASSQYSSDGNMPSITLQGNSLRQIIRTSVEGEYLRFHFTNYLGSSKMDLLSVHVAHSASQGSGKIVTETDTLITFDGKASVTIPAYGDVVSDTIKFSSPALTELAITIYFGDVPSTVTGHVGSRTYSFIEKGFVGSKEVFSSTYKTAHWYVLSAIDVSTNTEENNKKAIVCLGDSITDGRGTTNDKQDRWTDILATRLQANEETKHLAVLNHGIGGTTASSSGNSRFKRDVLGQTKVKYLVVLYGVNDILYANSNANNLENTYKNFIRKAHAAGITVYGGTILPFGKASGWTSSKEAIRKEVNKWIMETPASEGGFDGYIDFAEAMKDPSNELYLNSSWNFENDGLHPNAAGYKTMGELIDLSLFTKESEYLGDNSSSSNGSITLNDVNIVHYSLETSVKTGESVSVNVKGSNNGTGFRSWLVAGGTTNSNLYTDFISGGKDFTSGDFDISFSLTANGVSDGLYLKAPTYDTKINEVTITSITVTHNGNTYSLNPAEGNLL